MSSLSPNYCNKVERWILGGVPLEKMAMRPEQRYRAALVTDAYRHWIQNPTINPRTVIQNFARRDYAFILRKAQEGDPESMELVEVMHITPTSVRSENEVANDVALLNFLTGRLSTSKKNIHRAMYEANIEWMQNFGRKTGTWQAVKQANQDLAKINNDFKEDQNPADALRPGVERNITNDISIIKPDRENYSEQEIRAFAKKIGASVDDITEMIENEDGVFVSADEEDADNVSDEVGEQYDDEDVITGDEDPFKR